MPPVAAFPPRKMMKTLAAVVPTGGSSGAGKSFINLMAKVQSSLLFCNPSWRMTDIFSEELKSRQLCSDFPQSSGSRAGAEAELRILNREVPEGRGLLINTREYGAYGRFLEGDPGGKTFFSALTTGQLGQPPGAVIKIPLRAADAGAFRVAKVAA